MSKGAKYPIAVIHFDPITGTRVEVSNFVGVGGAALDRAYYALMKAWQAEKAKALQPLHAQRMKEDRQREADVAALNVADQADQQGETDV